MKKYLPILLISAQLINGQDFEQRFAPKSLKNNQLKQTNLNVGGFLSPISEDKDVVLKSLKGIRVLSERSAVSSKALKQKGLNLVSENGIMEQAEFQNMLSAHLNKPLSMHSLSKLTNAIVLYYRNQNEPVVDVVIPEQDITHGVLQLLVIEGRVGQLKVTGNKYFSDKMVLSNVRLKSGDKIYTRNLIDDMNWINNNPFLSAQPVFAPGAKAYSTNVLFQVKDERPWRYYVGYENSGNDLTGTNRYLLGFNMGNVLGRGHQLNYQLTTGDDFSELNAHSFSYIIPLNHLRHTLQFHGAYVDTESSTGVFDINGRSRELGARYTIPLTSPENLRHEFYGGVVWRNLDNSLEFGQIAASANSSHIGQFEVGYKRSERHHEGITGFNLGLTYAPGGLFGNSSDTDFSSSRTGAENSYTYLQISLNRLQKLPQSFTLSSEVSAQWSDTKLLSSEQFSVGGYSTVRGYDERELNGSDTGVIFRNELRFPELSLIKSKYDKTQFLIFSDYAWSKAHNGQVTLADGSLSDSSVLWSTGLGARIKLGGNLSLRADYGFQLKDIGSDLNTGKLHLGGIYSF